jgi:hypothetical protein
MIQLLTPPYFESPWCMAEWRSMQARQQLLGLASPRLPQSLVYSILYSDSDNFPLEGREIAWWDFKKFAQPDLVYQQSREYPDFHREVTKVAQDLAQLLPQVPKWRPDWPIVEKPEPVLPPRAPIPRFAP